MTHSASAAPNLARDRGLPRSRHDVGSSLPPPRGVRWHQAFLDPIIVIEWMILAMYGYSAYVMQQLYGCRLLDGKNFPR